MSILEQKDRALNSRFILNTLNVSIGGLEKALSEYVQEGCEEPFDMKTVPLSAQPLSEQTVLNKPAAVPGASEVAGGAGAPGAPKPESTVNVAGRQEIYAAQLSAVPEFAALGPLFKSSDIVELTEAETEYVVQCVKHTFNNHVVLQFNCTNTLQDQV